MENDLRRWMRLVEAVVANGSVITIDGRSVRINWNPHKDATNRRDHLGLSLADGIPAICDPNNYSDLDYDNQNNDERERYIGRSPSGILFVVCEWFDTGEEFINLQIILVRHAVASEIGQLMNEDAKPPVREPIDPDNPPLTGKHRFVPGAPRIKARLDAFAAKVAQRKATSNAAEQTQQKPDAAD